MLAGVPQLVLAAGVDRAANGADARRLGVGDCLVLPQCSASNVIESLRRLLDSPGMRARCQELSARLRESDGAVVASRLIEACVPASESEVREASRQGSDFGRALPCLESKMDSEVEVSDFGQSSRLLKRWGELSPERQRLLARQVRRASREAAGERTAEEEPA